MLTPPSGGADPRELVEPTEGQDDGSFRLAIEVVEVFPFNEGASHIVLMVFIILLTTQSIRCLIHFFKRSKVIE